MSDPVPPPSGSSPSPGPADAATPDSAAGTVPGPPVDPGGALARAAELVGDRWTLLVVAALLAGPRRFSELEQSVVGVAPNVLTQRLRHLERIGLVVSRPYSRRPLRHRYELTHAGAGLAEALAVLAAWHEPGAAGRHDACGTPLELAWTCPTCHVVVDDPGVALPTGAAGDEAVVEV